MAFINATTRPLLWTVHNGVDIVDSGMALIGQTTVTGLTLISDGDENALLGTLVLAGVSANPLPEAGAELNQGEIYDYLGTLVMVRKSHTRTEHAPTDVPALFTVWRADAGTALDWIIGEQVYIGTRRVFEGTLYSCLQAHQTQSDQEPSAIGILGVLWGVVVATPEWSIGVAYTGDNTAGAGKGDIVTYSGRRYRCRQSHTSIVTWAPTAAPALWLDLGPL
jgi:hypothetical protein